MSASPSSIIDNRDDNTLLIGLREMSKGGQEICIATAFFSLDALLLLSEVLADYDRVRILFGDDSDAKQRVRLLQMLQQKSDEDLLKQREEMPQLSPLKKVEALFTAGRVEARCYTAKKFHAKAYLIKRPFHPSQVGVIGSGNFTRPGLVQNIELNVELTKEQTAQLDDWFEERWSEASADVVTEDVLAEIRRQVNLYEPYVLYLKALSAWGVQQQDENVLPGDVPIWQQLDPHQEQGFRQALKILERQHGVMVCDGVGLGKSFVALALMEKFCRDGKNVLLLAPRNILRSSWQGYLDRYLSRYRNPFGSINEMAMTELGFDGDPDTEPASVHDAERRQMLEALVERADVIVVDESHNFRTTSASRYKNLFRIVAPARGRRKKIILLTATPINTAYRDMSAQLSLITHEDGSIGGYGVHQIRRFATELDKAKPVAAPITGQLTFSLLETPGVALNRVLESVLIQRSRKTCKALAEAKGKALRFPRRQDPRCIEYTIGPQSERYRDLISLANKRFRPGVEFIRQMRRELEEAEQKGRGVNPVKFTKGPPKGIKLAAFLIEQYRREPAKGRKQYQDEVHLAALVFSNTLKQLESSPPAFQGILQSLGIGLIARLRHVHGAAADELIAPHLEWVRTPLFPYPEKEGDTETDPDIEEDGDTLDASGEEVDEWLTHAIQARGLAKKLSEFNDEEFDVRRWTDDIEWDLKFLQEIHRATLTGREQPDPKLNTFLPVLTCEIQRGSRVLLFTQSQRTAEYLEKELKKRLPDAGVARIDSRVETTRAAILHAFSPGYNPPPPTPSPSVPARVDVLVSTDVLSEGVNLQEAGAIFNYDIHWNPVRLIQRIGRVDRRLDPRITPGDHSFTIYNVLPPKEINDIIDLVGVVENRTLIISRTLGLDASFFKSTDPANNLIEFNSQYEGEITAQDAALTRYVRLTTEPNPALQKLLNAIPPGAFGVWGNAPMDGLFALFNMEATPKATNADRERFASVLGRPVLVLERQNQPPLFDAGEILELLSGTIQDEPSATPSDEAVLSQRLKKLKSSVRQRFSDINLPATIVPKLVCWLELKKGNG